MEQGMKFDSTVSFLLLFHIGSLLVGGVILYMTLKQKMKRLEERQNNFQIWLIEIIRRTPNVDPAVIASINGENR